MGVAFVFRLSFIDVIILVVVLVSFEVRALNVDLLMDCRICLSMIEFNEMGFCLQFSPSGGHNDEIS